MFIKSKKLFCFPHQLQNPINQFLDFPFKPRILFYCFQIHRLEATFSLSGGFTFSIGDLFAGWIHSTSLSNTVFRSLFWAELMARSQCLRTRLERDSMTALDVFNPERVLT